MQFENSQELPINDSMRDDMFFKVSKSEPWYANIVNFMVAGYIPPGEDKKKLVYESHLHIWDPPYLFRVCVDDLLRRCVPAEETFKSLKDATHHHMEDIMGYSALMQKFGRVDSIGQPCIKTQKISSGDMEHVRSTGI
jgi:hypothetical protein